MTKRQELIQKIHSGDKPMSYCLFYGGPCSQWVASPFNIEGVWYPTAEHFMMAEKARTFGDEISLHAIMTTKDPAVTKALGRQVNGYDDAIWAARRYEIVKRGNLAKFSQNEPLATWLLWDSGDIIVECSPTDRIWGIGRDELDLRALDPVDGWDGENLLGFAIMEVREELRRRDEARRR
jgi:ribA/ribD-fused uncharacterized protein